MVRKLSRWSVHHPSPDFMNFFLSAQKIIVENWKSVGWKPQLKKVLQDLLQSSQVSLAWLTCSEHNNLVSEILMDLVLVRIIVLQCNKINKEKKEKRVRVTRQVAKATANSTEEGLEDINRNDWLLLTGLSGKTS